jgi:excisionase family DNA binding protein
MAKQTYLPSATIRPSRSRRSALRVAVANGITVELRSIDGTRITAPELEQLLTLALNCLARGDDIILLTSENELSPTEVGQVLGLSRQYVDRLIDLGDLPARQLPGSSHRRVRGADVVAFQKRREARKATISNAINELIDAGADY